MKKHKAIKLITCLALAMISTQSISADCKLLDGTYVVTLSDSSGKTLPLKLPKISNAQPADICQHFSKDNTGAGNIRISVKPAKLDGATIKQQYEDLVTSIKNSGLSAKIRKGKIFTKLKLRQTEKADFSKPGPMGGFRTAMTSNTSVAKVTVTIDLENVNAKDGHISVGEQVPEIFVEISAEFK